MRKWFVSDLLATIVAPDYFKIADIGATDTMIRGILSDRYGDMLLYTTTDELSLASLDFMRRWSLFKDTYLPQYIKIYDAITTSYEPLDNYNRVEGKSGFRAANAYTDTDTSTPQTHSKTTSKRGAYKTSEQVSTYDASLKNVSETTAGHSPGAMDTTEIEYLPDSNGDPLSDTLSKQHGAQREDYSETLNVHGNIGVMSTQEMMKQELEVRQYNIIESFVADFARGNFNSNIFGGCYL